MNQMGINSLLFRRESRNAENGRACPFIRGKGKDAGEKKRMSFLSGTNPVAGMMKNVARDRDLAKGYR